MYLYLDRPKVVFNVLILFSIVGIVVYLIILFKEVRNSPHPTYKQVCAPLNVVSAITYYNDKIYVVCGSKSSEPIIKYVP